MHDNPSACPPVTLPDQASIRTSAKGPSPKHSSESCEPWIRGFPRRSSRSPLLELLKAIERELALGAVGILADLGCGTGGPRLWRCSRHRRNWPASTSRPSRSSACGQLLHRCPVSMSDLAALELSTGSTDAAVANDALQFSAGRSAAAESRRILRPWPVGLPVPRHIQWPCGCCGHLRPIDDRLPRVVACLGTRPHRAALR